MNIKIKKLHPEAIIPTYATDGAGCFDLYAVLDTSIPVYVSHLVSVVIDTGIAFEIPQGHCMLIYSRSGHAFKNHVRLANCTGVIDADFTGSVKIKLASDNVGNEFMTPLFKVSHGDRIAQAMIIPVPKVTFTEVSELSETLRGDGGFGSTGS